MNHASIRFPHRVLGQLRTHLLQDLTAEHFAILLGKRHTLGDLTIVTIHSVRHPGPGDYRHQSLAAVSPERDFVYRVLVEAQRRMDVDTVIDVHTHPFAEKAWFSGTDDRDERQFCRYLDEKVDGLHYGSIVFSRSAYKARMWEMRKAKASARPARLKTQTAPEAVDENERNRDPMQPLDANDVQSRSALALGLDTLRRMTNGQFIVLAGVGGLGSVMAEHLIHQGFPHVGLIDPDRLEPSNLNRFVGGTHADAVTQRLKVDVVAGHLRDINPAAKIETLAESVDSPDAESMLARADWILLSTDNHSSRYAVQKTALTYYVPLISAGVNITVADEDGVSRIVDRSGEVIVSRAGDGLCLNCLGRINLARMVAESHPDPQVREMTLARGYVSGMSVKEPAVKTLNAMIGTLAIECLVDQYRSDAVHAPILVYESHHGPCLYPDRNSLEMLRTGCGLCEVFVE